MKRTLGTMTCLLGLTAATALSWRAGEPLRAGLGGPLLSDRIAALAADALSLALAWLTLLVVLVALEPWAGRELTGLLACPPVLRTLLVAGCGAAVAVTIAGAASASPTATSPDPTHPRIASVRDRLSGLPLPDRTEDIDRVARVTRPPSYVVRPGDTLWGIARRVLGPHAGDRAVELAWRPIYADNRDVVGADPGLILPGQRLRLTGPATAALDLPARLGPQKGSS